MLLGDKGHDADWFREAVAERGINACVPIRLVDQYQKCVEKAGDSLESVEACDVYLRSAEALK